MYFLSNGIGTDEDIFACSQVEPFDEFLDLSSFLSGAGDGKSAIGEGDMNQGINNSANSSTVASSLTTGSSSGISGGSNIQRNMSMNTNSTTSSGAASMGLPTSPLSFSSSNVSVPGSSGLVGSSLAQQGGSTLTRPGSQQDLMLPQQQLQQQIPSSSNGSQQPLAVHYGTQLQQEQLKLNFGQQITQPCDVQNLSGNQQLNGQNIAAMYGSQQVLTSGHQPLHSPSLSVVKQEQINDQPLTQMQASIAGVKMKQEDLLQHHLVQNMFQRPDSIMSAQLHRQESLQRQQSQHIQAQLSLLQQQQRLFQQQQIIQSLPQHIQRSHLQQQQQQLQHHLQQQIVGLTKQQPSDSGMCTRRLMQYMQNQRLRPADNSITFWRKFVAEYFAPHAKMRWCVSLYGAGGRQSAGVFPQDLYHCDLCGCNPGRGFDATLEVLPRLFKIKYDNGELEELLFVDLPQELKLNSGITIMKYEKAIQESVFEQLRVVRDGQLRIIFTPDLKILSWDFCARGHEELLPRRTVVQQVNQLAVIASKCQNTSPNGAAGISSQELQSSCNLFVASARQLAKNWEAPPINEIGFTKRFVRCLQISEVVNSMKDLIDFSQQNNIGPMESLVKFPRRMATSVGSQNQPLQLQGQTEFLVAEQNSNKLHPMQLNIEKQRALSAHANTITSFQSLRRQNSSSLQSVVQNDPSTARTLSGSGSFSNSLQASPTSSLTSLQTSLTSLSGNPQQPSLDSLSNSVNQNSMSSSLLQQSSLQPVQLNQQNTENVVHQLLQEMMSPQSNNTGNFMQGHRVTGLNAPSGNGIVNVFPVSGGLGMNDGNTGTNIGIMGNGLESMPSSLTGNARENGLNIANCLRSMGSNASGLGNMRSMNALGNRLNLAALAQQQNIHMQDGASNRQHDFLNGLNGLGPGAEFGSLPLNWKS